MGEGFFDSVCVFDYRGFCKNGGDCLKKHFKEICQNRNCLGESCLKRHPKSCIFFTTFGDCKFAEFCRYHHEGKNTHAMIELNNMIEQVETLKAEITSLKVENVEKEIKLKEMKKISEENDKLRMENYKLNKDNSILKKRLTSIEYKSMNIQSYQCDKCKFESKDRNKIEEHMTDNHNEIEKEYYVESDMIAVEICFICDKVFYSKEDLDNHKQLKFKCSICKVCVTEGSSEIDYCSAMEHAEKLTRRGFFGQPL